MVKQSYSVPVEGHKVLVNDIVNNTLHDSAPSEIKIAASFIEFYGTDQPSIPNIWRFAESIAAIKGFQGAMLNVLLKRRYGIDFQKITIDTDHAQLFIMSVLLTVIDPENEKITWGKREKFEKYFRTDDPYGALDDSLYKSACTSIYRTKDNRYYHIHGYLHPQLTQGALDLPDDLPASTIVEAAAPYAAKIAQINSDALDVLINDRFRASGTICLTASEYLASAHGKSNAHVGLFSVHHVPNPAQLPYWWPSVDGHTGPERPLFGLKVIDLTRLIAGPTTSRDLAELGASVLRITARHIPDIPIIHPDLHWGKWCADLDLREECNRNTLRDLIQECDVVLDGYRPGALAKFGFGKDDILKLFENKSHGVVYARENCYGWNGPLSVRPGYQQISDAVTGISYEFGRAMGNDEPASPIPLAGDYCTGAAGATGIMQALIERAEKGGSYVVDIALNYYTQWLISSQNKYPPEVWNAVWNRHGRPVLRHQDHLGITLGPLMRNLHTNCPELFQPEFFENRRSKALNVDIKTVKPVLVFPEGRVKPGFNVGARGNGVDLALWPKDLMTEILTEDSK